MPITAASVDPREVPHTGTLLIVDDNASMCVALRAYMSRVEGWASVLTAPDAAAALELAVVHCPAAIVLDNKMPPGSDGIDLLPRLRQACPRARIVMHTTEDTLDLREEAVRRGADAIVPKGHPLDELAGLLESA